MRAQTIELVVEDQPEEEEDDEMEVRPPLEFSVQDSEAPASVDGEVAFASEAIEEDDEDDLPQPLAPSLDDLRSAADRKRKGDSRPAPRQKTQRVSERCVPSVTSKY